MREDIGRDEKEASGIEETIAWVQYLEKDLNSWFHKLQPESQVEKRREKAYDTKLDKIFRDLELKCCSLLADIWEMKGKIYDISNGTHKIFHKIRDLHIRERNKIFQEAEALLIEFNSGNKYLESSIWAKLSIIQGYEPLIEVNDYLGWVARIHIVITDLYVKKAFYIKADVAEMMSTGLKLITILAPKIMRALNPDSHATKLAELASEMTDTKEVHDLIPSFDKEHRKNLRQQEASETIQELRDELNFLKKVKFHLQGILLGTQKQYISTLNHFTT